EELNFLDQSEFIIFESAGEFVCDASKAKTVNITFEATGELVVTTTADLSAEVIFESAGEFVCNAFIGPNIFTDDLIFEAAGEFECTPSISSDNLIIIEPAAEFECEAEVIS